MSTTRNPRPRDAVAIRLELSPTDRDRLMIAAEKSGKSMASYTRALLEGHLDDVEDAERIARERKEKR
jgi:predicted DNA-binding protein